MSTTKRDNLIERRAAAGATYAEIATDLGLSRERVRQILQRRGVAGSRGQWRASMKAAVEDVTKRGLAPTEAAKLRGVGVDSLRKALKAKGFSYAEARRVAARTEREAKLKGKGTTVCRTCGEDKSWAEMAMDTDRHGVERRRRVCQECHNAVTRNWYQRNRGRTPVPTVTEKECTHCGQTKPAAEFWRNTATSDGLQSWCKGCLNEHRREERAWDR